MPPWNPESSTPTASKSKASSSASCAVITIEHLLPLPLWERAGVRGKPRCVDGLPYRETHFFFHLEGGPMPAVASRPYSKEKSQSKPSSAEHKILFQNYIKSVGPRTYV